ncbi:antibiotic biosynthesis monooxygenase family protein [Streptomyces sp. NPDC052301]|uniref:antibiotic biosynthesis monooxygenase family protein n=1 Tax=Streptomyces sp. NPDC052301 TaxID=3365687 RepID=UPI0037D5FA7A
MSDHTHSPVTPTPEPPYYAVVFTSLRTGDDADGYGHTAEHLSRLVRDVPGFLGEDSAHTPGGLAISVAYFRDLDGIERWRRHPEHLAAKRRGRERWYERYVIHIARVEHTHAFARA